MMDSNSAKRHIVIFGGAGGIGSALARQLAAEGCVLGLVGRNASRLESLGNALGAELVCADATESRAVEHCFADLTGKWPQVDGVVNCVGSILLKPAHLTTDEEWMVTLKANLDSSFFILRAAASRMMRTGGGSIVLLTSAVAQRGMINHEAIAAAKAGVVGLAQSAAATYARYGIRVNCVAPGLTRTPLTQSLTRNEASLKASIALHPLGRIGEADEVARAIRWLLSPEQSFITGQVLAVDGGLASVQSRSV